MDPETDRKITNHVILGHRYRSDHWGARHDSDYDNNDYDLDEDMDDRDKVHSIWQRNRHNSLDGEFSDKDPHSNDILQHDFLRKYLHFAKTRMKPELMEGARGFIANRYAEMRCRQDKQTLPVTARTLETVIRLATAHAKSRLSNIVEVKPDCETAMDVLSFALYHEAGETNNQGTNKNEDDNAAEVSVLDNDAERLEQPDGLIEPSSKQQQTDDNLTEDKLKAQVLSELAQNDGYLPIDEICQDNENCDKMLKIVQTLVSEGKIMME